MMAACRLVPLALALAATATGQMRAPTASLPPGGPDNTFGGATVATPGSSYGPLPGLKVPDTNSSMFVTGRVVLDGGGVPPETVAIERVCVGSREVRGYTDNKGRFSIDLKRSNRLVFEAESSEREHRTDSALRPGGLDGCELRASLQGFRSDAISLAGRRVMDHPAVGVLVLHRLTHVEGTTISATSAMAPAPAKKAYAKAQEGMKKGKIHEAIANLESAVATYPKFAAAWYDLGQLRQMEKQDELAADAFKRSIEADSKYVRPYIALARRAIARKDWADAVRWSDQALRLDASTLPDAWLFNAMGNLFAGNPEGAEKSVTQLLELNGSATTPETEQVAGFVYVQRKNWPEAVAHLRRFISLSDPGPEQEFARRLLAQAERNGSVALQPHARPARP